MSSLLPHDKFPMPARTVTQFATIPRTAYAAVTEPLVKILFPHLQLSLVISLLLVINARTSWTTGLFCLLLLVWYTSILTRLVMQSWRQSLPALHLCSVQAAMAAMAASWYGVIGFSLGLPAAGALGVLTVATLALFGWVCREV
jgi:hypothetical protein